MLYFWKYDIQTIGCTLHHPSCLLPWPITLTWKRWTNQLQMEHKGKTARTQSLKGTRKNSMWADNLGLPSNTQRKTKLKASLDNKISSRFFWHDFCNNQDYVIFQGNNTHYFVECKSTKASAIFCFCTRQTKSVFCSLTENNWEAKCLLLHLKWYSLCVELTQGVASLANNTTVSKCVVHQLA